MLRTAILLTALASPAQAITHAFCWIGANGYRVEGFISYPDGLTGIVTEADVTGFGITGWRDDTWLGQWSLKDLTPETSWTLRFDADRLAFRMGGYPSEGTYQEWNANGFADDCGDPGFGFNGGNRAQDVCVDGVFIDESGIPPDTPLGISPDPSNPCGPLPMSNLPMRRHVG
ncbi:MAG: hypothetical protein AAGF30_02000 [Pseudomonadota bacterium]